MVNDDQPVPKVSAAKLHAIVDCTFDRMATMHGMQVSYLLVLDHATWRGYCIDAVHYDPGPKRAPESFQMLTQAVGRLAGIPTVTVNLAPGHRLMTMIIRDDFEYMPWLFALLRTCREKTYASE